MSYSSHSVLPRSARLSTVRELIYSLGYKRDGTVKGLPTQTDTCFWFDSDDYRSWVGVELEIYRSRGGRITVSTRTTISRSYWDLAHQNRTIKLLRDCYGGSFTTDEGKGRYLRPRSGPPSPLSSGCYLAHWRFLNAIRSTHSYVSIRKQEPTNKKLRSYIGDYMPDVISSNLVLPYLVAVWEEYFRATFTATLQYSPQRDAALKRARLTSDHLEKVLTGHTAIERALAETFGFQRPSADHRALQTA
jgi:hypothetical protein